MITRKHGINVQYLYDIYIRHEFPYEKGSCKNIVYFLFQDSSVVFRPTLRSKISAAEISASQLSKPVSTNLCDEAPTLLGFDGPLNSVDVGVAITEDVESVYYTCFGGKVVDKYTNRRMVRLACANITNFQSPKKWPKCRQATHCVGSPKKPGEV